MALALVKPWSTQPYRTVGVNWSNPLSNGLVFARLGGTQTSVWPGNNFTRTGTRIRGSQFGLADGFGSTLGVGTTDSINSNYGVNHTRKTIFTFCYYNGSGGGSRGRLLNADGGEALYTNTGDVRYEKSFSSNTGSWYTTSTIFTAGKSFSIAVTYNGTSTANVPVLFVNGRNTVNFSTIITPSGTIANNTGNYVIGNTSDGLRNWDGLIAETYIWNRILTPAEIFSIHSNPWQIFTGVEVLGPPTPYPILSNLQATRGNTSASLRTNITY